MQLPSSDRREICLKTACQFADNAHNFSNDNSPTLSHMEFPTYLRKTHVLKESLPTDWAAFFLNSYADTQFPRYQSSEINQLSRNISWEGMRILSAY